MSVSAKDLGINEALVDVVQRLLFGIVQKLALGAMSERQLQAALVWTVFDGSDAIEDTKEAEYTAVNCVLDYLAQSLAVGR